jgi:cytochrome c nitrite reductase small subunit
MRPESWPARARSRGGQTLTLLAVVAVGALGGLGLFTFGYGDGAVYLRDDPAACANCHAMWDQYDSWANSSHKNAATCNDCHVLHDPIGKWITKADNGFFHSLAFTTGNFPDPIRIKPRNRRVTQAACLYCHAELVHLALSSSLDDEAALCARCHADVGHAQR